jgi:hypothetical protein
VDKSISTTAAACSVAVGRWWPLFEQVTERIAVRFRRAESRLTARAFVAGLLSAVERKNCWWLAQQAGHRSPRRMQRLLGEAVWDAEAVRDDVRAFVVEQLAHPDAVLICDETGFLKKGRASAGVQRQYSGTAGRIENSQVAVFLSYASARGRALIDRRHHRHQPLGQRDRSPASSSHSRTAPDRSGTPWPRATAATRAASSPPAACTICSCWPDTGGWASRDVSWTPWRRGAGNGGRPSAVHRIVSCADRSAMQT